MVCYPTCLIHIILKSYLSRRNYCTKAASSLNVALFYWIVLLSMPALLISIFTKDINLLYLE